MENWWRSLTLKQQIAIMVAIIGAIGGISLALNVSVDKSTKTTQTNIDGDSLVNTGLGDINTDNKMNQETMGDNSPSVNGTKGDVIMNMP